MDLMKPIASVGGAHYFNIRTMSAAHFSESKTSVMSHIKSRV